MCLAACAQRREVYHRLAEAADLMEEMLADEETRNLAREIAANLSGRLPVIWGSSGPAEVAAQRWAKQMHENAKTPAYWSTIPELDHNGITTLLAMTLVKEFAARMLE